MGATIYLPAAEATEPPAQAGQEVGDPFEETPAEVTGGTVTEAVAREMGFSEEQLEALEACGILIREERRVAWEPKDLRDMEWVLTQRKTLLFQIAERERLHQVEIARLRQAEQSLARWDELLLQITLDNLPRTKAGKFSKKSLVVGAALAKAKTEPERVYIANESHLLDHLQTLPADHPLWASFRATITETMKGAEAMPFLTAGDDPEAGVKVKPSFVITPVAEWTKETGELPPGTDRKPAREVFGFE